MQLHFTGRNIDVTPALKTFAQEKFQRLQHRHENINSVNVILLVEKLDHIAEATLHIDGTDIHAKAESKDMYTAIDLLIDKLLAQVTKIKEKHTDHR
jgi:putative sigma-54 modulation protein